MSLFKKEETLDMKILEEEPKKIYAESIKFDAPICCNKKMELKTCDNDERYYGFQCNQCGKVSLGYFEEELE
jgi:hypothetical protein